MEPPGASSTDPALMQGKGMNAVLYKAATQGKVAILRQLVAADPEILESTTPQLNTALHLAALYGHADFAREVLDKKTELLVVGNADGDTPLHLAAKAGNLKVAELLIRRVRAWSEDPSTAGTPLRSPLTLTNVAGNTPLHEAVRHRRGAVAVALLDADPSRGHDLNERMESPLHMASKEGLVNVVRKIVDHAWVETEFLPSVSPSGTALHQAVLGGHIQIVQILLEKRPELVVLADSDGNNALHYAAQKNDQLAVEMLLNTKTELAYKRNQKNLSSPLHVAAHYGSTDAIKALLRNCPDTAEMVDIEGRNAFHAAVCSGRLNALRCLLRHIRPSELFNRVDKDGNIPLHLAAKMSCVTSALMLLNDMRVDPCVRGHEGHTARSLIEQKIVTGEMDAFEMYMWKKLKQQEAKRCRKQQPQPLATYPSRRTSNEKYFERIVETYIIVATLIATVTFAATFTMPGGYDQNTGIAMHGHRTIFKIFVISNTVAMCSSIVSVFCFMWAWQDPIKFKVDQLLWGHWLTIIACVAMLVSLMAAVFITVPHNSRWLAYVVIFIGTSTPFVVLLRVGREVIYVPL